MTVYLVGAGPGDPGLLTRRGAALLARADVVVHDHLVAPDLLRLTRPGAELVAVTRPPSRSRDEVAEQTAALLVARGRQGGVVVRLHSGDPYLFGRGAGEAAALGEAGVAYEVVPGVSAAVAAPELAGIPVVRRGLGFGVAVVSGRAPIGEEWAALSRVGTTLVVVMGEERRGEIAATLLQGGLAPETPVAVIERASASSQHSTRTTLHALGDTPVVAPATLVIGAPAALRLAGLEDRPLFGRRVVVTRAPAQSGELEAALSALGAEVVVCPTLEITDPPDKGAALRAALGDLSRFAWVVFTSVNAVERVFAELRDARALAGPAVAAVGETTAAALARHGVAADLVPKSARTTGLLAAFPAPRVAGEAVLLPRALVGGDELRARLVARGFSVEVVTAYVTRTPDLASEVRAAIAKADAVTFASGSAITGFLALAGRAERPPVVATIGPVTSAAARAAGLEVAVEAEQPSADALASALGAHFAALRFGHG